MNELLDIILGEVSFLTTSSSYSSHENQEIDWNIYRHNFDHEHRYLEAAAVSQQAVLKSAAFRWKSSAWDRNYIEPAMLRAPIIILLFAFLWAINIYVFDEMRLQYYNVLGIKNAPIHFVVVTAIALSSLYALDITVSTRFFGLSIEFGVGLYYSLVFLVSSFFVSFFPWRENYYYLTRLMRSVFMPGSSVSFAEILFADALTSLSKVLRDVGITLIAIYCSLVRTDIIKYHDFGIVLLTVFTAMPFVIRIRQCIVQLSSAPDTWSKCLILFNIFKYATCLPPLWLSASMSLGDNRAYIPTVIFVTSAINSTMGVIWDVTMDWGLLSCTKNGSKSACKLKSMFSFQFHAFVFVANLLLRFTWAAKFFFDMSSIPPAHMILILELCEVIRRFLWIFLRVEWEIILQNEKSTTVKVKELLDV